MISQLLLIIILKNQIQGVTALENHEQLKWLLLLDDSKIRYFSYQATSQLSSRGWVEFAPDPIILEKILGYSWDSNPVHLG